MKPVALTNEQRNKLKEDKQISEPVFNKSLRIRQSGRYKLCGSNIQGKCEHSEISKRSDHHAIARHQAFFQKRRTGKAFRETFEKETRKCPFVCCKNRLPGAKLAA
ncbi:MAG: hypothetical protein LBR98_10140 [Syntrophomonadaceae bacterium]|jgi:hypothetical protein|nr:hypothetical protein [Syntrophomonadaceae bacterium]